MANVPEPGRRKTRTRQHVIADLGVNFTERQVLLAGFTADRSGHDYGIDMMMKTFSPSGEVEPGHVLIQVKATDHFTTHADGLTFPFRVSAADLRHWLFEWGPVVLVVYDAGADRAYWVHLQDYARHNNMEEDGGGDTVTLRVPVSNVWDIPAVHTLRSVKERDGSRRRPDTSG